MKQFFLLLLCCFFIAGTKAQTIKIISLQTFIDSVNRVIDRSVVEKKIALLQKYYADDFVFTHGTGLVDSKKSWLKNVADTSVHYISREHDSTSVEMHKDIAIITGTLTVRRQMPARVNAYALRYVRVFAFRKNQWQMISHRTTSEWHLTE